MCFFTDQNEIELIVNLHGVYVIEVGLTEVMLDGSIFYGPHKLQKAQNQEPETRKIKFKVQLRIKKLFCAKRYLFYRF